MEAIQPGSSTMVRSPKADEAFTKDDRHAYENFEVPKSHDAHDEPPESSIYDELDSDKAQAQEPPLAETAHEYDEPTSILMSPAITSCVSPSMQSQLQTLPSNKEDSGGDDDGRIYSNIPDELDQDLYNQTDLLIPAPREGATTPEEVDEDNLDPNKMQLWLLLQIQKMVQKMEDVCGKPSPKLARRKANNLPRRTKSQLKPPPTTSSPDPPSQAVIQKEINNEDMESEPTRQHLYESMDTINEAIMESSPPPIPQRTYQVIDSCSKIGHVSKPPASKPQSDEWSQTNTLPSQSAACPKPPPVRPKDIQVRQHQIELRAGKNTYNTCIFSS